MYNTSAKYYLPEVRMCEWNLEKDVGRGVSEHHLSRVPRCDVSFEVTCNEVVSLLSCDKKTHDIILRKH